MTTAVHDMLSLDMEFDEPTNEASVVALAPRQMDQMPDDEQLLAFDKLADTAKQETHRTRLPHSVDLIVEVVNDNEWLTALYFLELRIKYNLPKCSACWLAGFKDVKPDKTVILVRTYSTGSSHSASMLEDVLQLFRPRVVFGIGCGFGFDNVKDGDVLVSEMIAGYEAVRENKQSRENRNQPHTIHGGLLKTIQSLSQWSLCSTEGQPIGQHLGVLLCGEKLLDNQEIRDAARDVIASKHTGSKGLPLLNGKKIIGGEMEGSGIAIVCAKYYNLPCAIVKGKSDSADGNKNEVELLGKSQADEEAVAPSGDRDVPAASEPAVTMVKKEEAGERQKKVKQRKASYAAWHLVRTLVTDNSFASIHHYAPSSSGTDAPKQLLLEKNHKLFPVVTAFLRAKQQEAKVRREAQASETSVSATPQQLLTAVEEARENFGQAQKRLLEAEAKVAEFTKSRTSPALEQATSAVDKATKHLHAVVLKPEDVSVESRAGPLMLTVRTKAGDLVNVQCSWKTAIVRDVYKKTSVLYMDAMTHLRMQEDIRDIQSRMISEVSARRVNTETRAATHFAHVFMYCSLCLGELHRAASGRHSTCQQEAQSSRSSCSHSFSRE